MRLNGLEKIFIYKDRKNNEVYMVKMLKNVEFE